MDFIDEEHEAFWNEKYKIMQKYGKTDVYYKSIVYTLGICPMTRKHFDKIFSIENGEINIDSLQSAWQTESSEKVTRMAFSLWNRCKYDSIEDAEKGNISSSYNPSEIFCCSYAPYFWEAVKIRYPEYTNQKKNELRAGIYMRFGNIEQLDHYIKEEIDNKLERNIVGLYIRSGLQNGDEVNNDIYSQERKLEDYCKQNNYSNRIQYIDVRKSGLDKDRIALKKMIQDIDAGKINKVIVTSPSKLYRETLDMAEFLTYGNFKDIDIISIDQGKLNTKLNEITLLEYLKVDLKEEETEEYIEDYEETDDMEY